MSSGVVVVFTGSRKGAEGSVPASDILLGCGAIASGSGAVAVNAGRSGSFREQAANAVASASNCRARDRC
jgi:hypothetical protein